MSISSVVTEELKGLNEEQLQSIYRLIKTFKKKKVTINSKDEIPLEEIWKITSKSKDNWSHVVKELREERF